MTDEERAILADNIDRLAAVRDRIARAMGWRQGAASHIFEVWRKTGNGEAIALGIDKAEQLADRLEQRHMRMTTVWLVNTRDDFTRAVFSSRTEAEDFRLALPHPGLFHLEEAPLDPPPPKRQPKEKSTPP